jgi:uncharacterized protein YjbI with pentapeptide repeats
LESDGYEGKRADLTGEDLSGRHLSDVNLTQALLLQADLSDAEIRHSELRDADLRGATLSGATLYYVDADGTDFSNGILSDTEIKYSELPGAVFREAIVTNALFLDVKLRNADFEKARLDGTELNGANLQSAELRGGSFESASLVNADLEGASIRDGNLYRVDLEDANADNANFQGSNLRAANLTGANFDEANLREANLYEVKGLQSRQLGRTCVANARLPEEVAEFQSLDVIDKAIEGARKVLLSIIVICVYAAVTAVTIDTGSEMSRLPLVGVEVSTKTLYVIVPALLVPLQIYFLLQLQHVWNLMVGVPAIFPDGKTIDEKVRPWIVTGLARYHFFRMGDRQQPNFFQDRAPAFYTARWWVAVLVGWLPVPTTLTILLASDTADSISLDQVPIGTSLALLILVSTGFSAISSWTTGRTLEGKLRGEAWTTGFADENPLAWRDVAFWFAEALLALLALLILLVTN